LAFDAPYGDEPDSEAREPPRKRQHLESSDGVFGDIEKEIDDSNCTNKFFLFGA
jgi:hypothetical protein